MDVPASMYRIALVFVTSFTRAIWCQPPSERDAVEIENDVGLFVMPDERTPSED